MFVEVKNIDKSMPFKLIPFDRINAIFPVKLGTTDGTRITYANQAYVETTVSYEAVKEFLRNPSRTGKSIDIIQRLYEITE